MPRPVRSVLVTALLLATAAGCGDAGGLQGAGPTPTATSPAKLWPQLTPASSPAWNYDDGESEVVKGVTVPDDDVRKVDPVAVVRAEIRRHPDSYSGSKATYRETTRRMAYCGRTPADSRCPVLKAYYRDLTGDGHPDLTLGFRLLPGNQTAVRVYTVQGGRLVQVMNNDDAVSGVELAGHSVIIHAPSDLADYEYRFQWTWDPEQHVMLLTHDEMLHIGKRRPASPTPAPSVSP
ncbi:hypothetical protein DI272_16460 [Streptomyces sp. Act143]|uniref:hypothetical protein n=1 Tax=Streptomyces sp. Act143 TaxID=2200760 RepID=UPI000D67FD76|nr:hypothetical protein [Streptomyces sp. Act143]PWI15586.1 hypothetical protein DI272_16460 [Streptomyces sp. Act143]